VVGLEFRLIDYLDGSQQGIPYYLKALQDKGYVYGTHYLPHDAQTEAISCRRKKHSRPNLRGVSEHGDIIPQLSIEDGIAAARSIFNRCVFDSEKCADGLQALRHYRYETDEKLQKPEEAPTTRLGLARSQTPSGDSP
jgi:phage terminase large subunit